MATREFRRYAEPPWVASECDRLLQVRAGGPQSGDVWVNRDIIIVDQSEVKHEVLNGLCVGRHAYFAHEFRVDPSMGMLSVAGRMVAHALDFIRRRRIRYVFFVVDSGNYAMQKFIESQGAIREKVGTIYRLEIPAEEADKWEKETISTPVE
jgi:ribosomal protein S18 acetylase RimI-like enzyme